MELMEKLDNLLRERPAELKEAKKMGRKVIGYLGDGYVPEELIYASGAIPLRLVRGGDAEPAVAASAYTLQFACPLVKAQLGYRLMHEEPFYQLIDMAIIGITCVQMRRMASWWKTYANVDTFQLGVPKDDSEQSLDYYIKRLRSLKENLENLTNIEITDEKLRDSITLYNRMRGILKDISLLRKTHPPKISGKNFLTLCHATHCLDQQTTVSLLSSFFQKFAKAKGTDFGDLRIFLTGPALAVGDYKVVDLIEDNNAVVVAEEFCEGIRHYWINAEDTDEPLNALAKRYLQKRAPAAYQRPSKKRIDFVVEKAKEFAVDGIVWYQLKFCETYDLEYYYFSEVVKELGLPIIKIESNFEAAERIGLMTRIEAFIESIRRR